MEKEVENDKDLHFRMNSIIIKYNEAINDGDIEKIHLCLQEYHKCIQKLLKTKKDLTLVKDEH